MLTALKEKMVPEKITIDIEQQIIDLFSRKKIDYSWSFSDKTRKDTTYISHGYHMIKIYQKLKKKPINPKNL